MMNEIFKFVLFMSLSGTAISIPFIYFKSGLLKKYNGKWYYFIGLFILLLYLMPTGYLAKCFMSGSATTKEYYQIAAHQVTELQRSISWFDRIVIKGINQIAHNKILGSIWIAGVVCSNAYTIYVYRLFYGRVKSTSAIICDSILSETFQQILLKMDMKEEIRFLVNDDIPSPFMIGLFRPIIVLPRAVLVSNDLELVIIHELTHFKNKDIFLKRAIAFVKSVHWFNPFVYPIAKAINEACEYACDYDVTKFMTMDLKARYANMLLDVMRVSAKNQYQDNSLTSYLFKDRQNIKRRLELIMTNNKGRKLLFTTAIVTGMVTVSAISTAAANRNIVTLTLPSDLEATNSETNDETFSIELPEGVKFRQFELVGDSGPENSPYMIEITETTKNSDESLSFALRGEVKGGEVNLDKSLDVDVPLLLPVTPSGTETGEGSDTLAIHHIRVQTNKQNVGEDWEIVSQETTEDGKITLKSKTGESFIVEIHPDTIETNPSSDFYKKTTEAFESDEAVNVPVLRSSGNE